MDSTTIWFLCIAIPTAIAIATIATKIVMEPPYKWIKILFPLSCVWIFILAMLGCFIILFRMNGAYMQPLKAPKYEQVQEPLYRLK